MGLNIDDVLRSNDEMSEAIQRVRELHKPFEMKIPYGIVIRCKGCECYEDYPCPTLKALDGEQ